MGAAMQGLLAALSHLLVQTVITSFFEIGRQIVNLSSPDITKFRCGDCTVYTQQIGTSAAS